jgi:anti-sigma-K factor RskA
MTPPGDTPVDGDVTAAELALGLLEGDERSAAMRRLLAEPDFARAVEQWRAHFGTLIPAIPDAMPPANGWARLNAAITPAASATNDNAPVRRWQAIAGLSGLVAASLVAALVLRPAPLPPSPTVVVQQSPVLIASIDAGKGAPIAAVYYPDKDELRIAPASLADHDHSAELWVIAADGEPHSLGVLKDGTSNVVAVDRANAQRFVAGSKLVVTREQPGGSPDGKPKGPAVAAGPLQTV